jgi:serine/threonine-protein kinase
MSLLGRKLLQYEIRKLLGSGGMGEVYEAVDPVLGARIAVKALHPHLAVRKDQAARFLGEAIAASQVRTASGRRNENIINVIGRDEIDGQMVLLMEFLEGADLEEWLARRAQGGHGPLAIDDVCRIVLQVCYALDGVHRAGFVHRDLKPQNLFIVDDGPRRLFLKVLDFGIAKIRADLRVTNMATAGPMGTLQYMAPEQANAPKLVDARADVWAIGCILYCVLTGGMAFDVGEADTWGVELRARQAAGELPPRPSLLRRDIDPFWDTIVARCLQYERENRYPDVQMLAADIIKAAGDDGPAVFAEMWPGGFVTGPDEGTVRNAAAAIAARLTPPPAVPSTIGSMGGAAGMVEPRAIERTPRWVWPVIGGVIGGAVLVTVLATRGSDPAALEPATAPAAVALDAAGAATRTAVDAGAPAPVIDAAAATGAAATGAAAELAVDAGAVDAGVAAVVDDGDGEPPTRRTGRHKTRRPTIDAGVREAAPPDAAPSRRRFDPDGVIRP